MINCPKACGNCCKVIILINYKDISLEEQWIKRKDKCAKWLLSNLIRISLLKAIRINNLFKGQHQKIMSYFICKNYDYEINKCKAYKKWRPYMCTDYPIYKNQVIDAKHFWNVPECYYINQLMMIH